MRSKFLLLPLFIATMLAGCVTDDVKETGITRSQAITIAERHCSEYPDTYGYVDRSEWDPDGKFWSVALTNYEGTHGKAYKIARDGSIIATHTIDMGGDNGDDYDHHYHGWGYWW